MDLLIDIICSVVNVLLSGLITWITTRKLFHDYCQQRRGKTTKRRIFWLCLICFCFCGVLVSILHYQLFVFMLKYNNDETVNNGETFVTQYFVVICIWLVTLPLHLTNYFQRLLRHIFIVTRTFEPRPSVYGTYTLSCICFIGATFICINYYSGIKFDSINSNTFNASTKNFYLYSLLCITIYIIMIFTIPLLCL